jgi:lysophospholipase L1-like esterase
MRLVFDIAAHCPDLAVYMAGTNDLRNNVLPSTTATNITNFITRAKAKSCDVLLVMPIPNAEETTHTYTWDAYRQALYGVAYAKTSRCSI